MIVHKSLGEECGVGHYVAVIGDECVALLRVEGVGVEAHAVGVLLLDILHHAVDDLLLHLLIGLAAAQKSGKLLVAQRGEHAVHELHKSAVGEQGIVDCGQFLRRVGTYLVKFLGYVHPAQSSKQSSMMSASTSPTFLPAAFTCWGMKLVAVMPGVVLISSRWMRSAPRLPVRM